MSDVASQVQPAPTPYERPASPNVDAAISLPAPPRLRVWPAVAVIVLMLAVLWVPVWVEASGFVRYMCAMWAPMGAAAVLAFWWLFFSRVRWLDRGLGLAAFAVGAPAAYYLSPMGAAQPMGPMLLIVNALPVVLTVWVLWLIVASFLGRAVQLVGLIAVPLLACGAFICLRFDGLDGNFRGSLAWRWSPTAEDKFLAATIGKASSGAGLTLQAADWPGFRGLQRDGRRAGVRFATDWKQSPPQQLWRHLVGPGWGSFAVVGDAIYTQEQRGKNESVVCYQANTGKQIWAHDDLTRFHEDVGGDGPRGTPTYYDGKIYALGATGRLNCLDALTGQLVWSRDIAADSGAKLPMWGFSASPLVFGGVVTVFAGGPGDKSVLAYDPSSDKPPVWAAGKGEMSYSSPHPARIGGVDQVLCSTEAGLTSIDPAKGEVLWQYNWPQGMHRIIQPTVVDDSDVLIGSFGETRRVHVRHDKDGWTTEDVWSTSHLKPNFSDTVVLDGYAYGFDSEPSFVCIGLEDGAKKWRRKGFGAGQVLLLADQKLLLVMSEKPCAVALVQATPDGYKELGRLPVFDAKTWNHPVVAQGKLFLRNAEEAACYQLTEEAAAAK